MDYEDVHAQLVGSKEQADLSSKQLDEQAELITELEQAREENKVEID